MSNPYVVPPQVLIGHVHLTVFDLPRALGFYRDIPGFEGAQAIGNQVAFLSSGGQHHQIRLNTWAGGGAPPPLRGTTGLYPLAILYPGRAELVRTLRRLLEHGYPLEGAADHGVGESIYLRDP